MVRCSDLTVRSAVFATFVLVSGLALAAIAKAPTPASAQPLYLNEIMASNSTTNVDEDGDAEDWIELYYAGNEPLNLNGFWLSDDYDEPYRWMFPDTTIQPGDFLLVWASGKHRMEPGGELHTNFSIAQAGEEVILTSPGGTRIDELKPTEIPTDISIGRYPDGTGDWHFYTDPTPGEPNTGDGYREILDPVTFSHDGGFYTDDISLKLTHPDPDVTIIYTLDGSRPELDNLDGATWHHMDRYRTDDQELLEKSYRTHLYNDSLEIHDRSVDPNHLSRMQTAFEQESVQESSPDPWYVPSDPVFKGTVVRATAVKEGAVSAGIQTQSYFITEKARDRYVLPVISLAIQEDELFDYENGIYVPGIIFDDWFPGWQSEYPDTVQLPGDAPANYTEKGIDTELPAHMELFEPESPVASHQQNLGVRVHGGWSRAFPLKSIRLYARNEYSSNRFYYPMFPDQPYNEYNRLILRNAGNDFEYAMLRDPLGQAVIGHLKPDTQAYRPYIVFINGEFWGMLNMRERYDSDYLARVHGAEPGQVDILEDNGLIREGDNTHYRDMMAYITDHPMQDDAHFDSVRTMMDVSNYIDYKIGHIFAGNTDWPHNNIYFWRASNDTYDPDAPGQLDGRWRWLIKDLDFGFYLYGQGPGHNTLAHALREGDWSTVLFRELMENEQFRRDFINRYQDQLNTAFLPDRVTGIVRQMTDHIEPVMEEHIHRWGRHTGGFAGWKNHIDIRLLAYGEQRADSARKHLKNYFDLGPEHDLTISVSSPARGRIRVNTIEISPETAGIDADPWPWTGTYFEGNPVTLKAKPWPGYRFSHWQGLESQDTASSLSNHLAENPEITLHLTGASSLTAVFEQEEAPETFPEAFEITEDEYAFYFDFWPADADSGTWPDHMGFVYMDDTDPGLDAEVAGFTSGFYNLEDRTRINGLGDDGFAFINTSSEEGNPGYPGTRLGGAILALNTSNAQQIEIGWEGMTLEPNSRMYHLRLQYRLGDEGPFKDLLDEYGDPVEYKRNEEAGHRAWIGPVLLPADAENTGYVQLMWRYYYSGERVDHESGQRSRMAVTRIDVEAREVVGAEDDNEEDDPDKPNTFALKQNHPNPFNSATTIRFDLPESREVTLEIYDLLGRRIAALVEHALPAGSHHTTWDAGNQPSGIYIYRLEAGDYVETRKMTLIR